MYKMSEDKAARILVEICSSMPEKIATAGKLLYFGDRIFKTVEAKAKLKPIRSMLASSYHHGGSVSGKVIVKKSQIAMGEAAYRTAVAAGGKDQSDLTIGWKVLGLDKEKATEIWNEVRGENFITSVQAKYGTAHNRDDDKGRKIDGKGELVNPEEAVDDDDNASTGNVFECSKCGFTLFIAEGRDFKFYGDDFKCPECRSHKDEFIKVKVED